LIQYCKAFASLLPGYFFCLTCLKNLLFWAAKINENALGKSLFG
jgi:hypothetical protein